MMTKILGGESGKILDKLLCGIAEDNKHNLSRLVTQLLRYNKSFSVTDSKGNVHRFCYSYDHVKSPFYYWDDWTEVSFVCTSDSLKCEMHGREHGPTSAPSLESDYDLPLLKEVLELAWIYTEVEG